jgi:Ni,Fe-hydrogenase maturation factor
MGSIKVFVFGTENDPLAWKVADRLKGMLPTAKGAGFSFIKTDNPDDITEARNKNIIIIDAASGIKTPTMLSIKDLKDKQSVTAHDLDLGFMLKLLEKTGKLDIKTVRIIGIPRNSKPNTATAEKVSRLLKQLYVEETSS